MTRKHVLMVLGALVLIAPWSGLPFSWLEWILPVLGLGVVGVALTMPQKDVEAPLYVPPAPTLPLQPEEPRPRSSNIAFS